MDLTGRADRRCWLRPVALAATAAALCVLGSSSSGAVGWDGDPAPAAAVALEDLVFLSDDFSPPFPGCDDITVVDSRSGLPVAHSDQYISTGKLAATSSGSLVLTVSNNQDHFVAAMRRSEAGPNRWTSSRYLTKAMFGAAIAVSPDDRYFLFGRADGSVVKYGVEDLTKSSLGPIAGEYRGPLSLADISIAADSRTAYLVAAEGEMHTVDLRTMKASVPPLAFRRFPGHREQRIRMTYAAMSPDGRYMIINTGGPKLTVIDLLTRESVLLATPELRKTYGIEFGHAGIGSGQLAVHGHSAVAVYKFSGFEALTLVAAASVPPQDPLDPFRETSDWLLDRLGSIAWSGRGDAVIAAIGGQKEYRILQFTGGESPTLQRRIDFDVCEASRPDIIPDMSFDVITLNDRLAPVPTASPTATPTSQPTLTPTATQETPSPTPTRRATASPSPAPPVTTLCSDPRPSPAYFPIALREHCRTARQRSDIALVMDTSGSMAGQKLNDAKLAAQSFVGLIDLGPGRAQVAVVRFDREAEVVRELTRSQALIEAAIRSLQVRSGTHIDKGLRAALGELQSPRHLDRNLPVMILLTDGLQTGTPGEELRAAAEVRDAGVRLYTIGLGADVDEAALKTMAGDESRYYDAPDSTDLARIYGEIAQDLMCPGKELWGGR